MKSMYEFFVPPQPPETDEIINTRNSAKERLDTTTYSQLSDAQKNDLLSFLPNDPALIRLQFSTVPEIEKAQKEEYLKYLFAKDTTDIRALADKRAAFPASISYYGSKFSKTNKASFRFMTDVQRKALRQQLFFALTNVFLPKFRLEVAENQQKKDLDALKSHIVRITELMQELDKIADKDLNRMQDQIYQESLNDELAHSEKYLKYLGLTLISRMVVEQAVALSSAGAGNTAISEMSGFNFWRLYWVWGGGFLRSILELLPQELDSVKQTKYGVNLPAITAGYISWTLYYARFGVHLGLLLKHTIAGPWMSKEEAKIPMWQRFRTQWDIRKFALLNDLIWGTANLLCFVWLYGPGMLGWWGNLATLGLLLMDLTIAIWARWEGLTRLAADEHRYTRDLRELNIKITQLDETGDRTADQQKELAELNEERKDLKAKLDHLRFEAKHELYRLNLDLTYSIAIIISFSIVCSFYMLPGVVPGAIALALAAIGSVLCFSCNVTYAGLQGYLDVLKSQEIGANSATKARELRALCHNTNDPNEQRFYYLDVLELEAKSAHQREMVAYKRLKLIHVVTVQALVPALLFTVLMFMPLGSGLAVFGAALFMALALHTVLEKFDPSKKTQALPEFDEVAFEAFARQENFQPAALPV